MHDNTEKRPKAVLASLRMPQQSEEEHDSELDELERLVHTLGFDCVARVTQKRKTPQKASIFGAGKLKELASYTGGTGRLRSPVPGAEHDEDEEDDEEPLAKPDVQADLVVLDRELSPTQLRNLEDACGVEVLDRTAVILEIFSRHANSKEARMQVEMAKLAYLAPRLRLSKMGQDRQSGGIGGRGGAGETAHELDKRRIRDRIAELKRQLEAMHDEKMQSGPQRRRDPSVALVGYTNAGKSSLLRALTGQDSYVADKLFATLSTRTKALQLKGEPSRILISDTVGFIRKLPHDLVASFRSTLDEAAAAALQLLVVDAADPSFRAQFEVTQQVLAEIDADKNPRWLVLNKADKLEAADREALQAEYPEALLLSTQNAGDIEHLKERLRAFFDKDLHEETFLLPYADASRLGALRAQFKILEERAGDEGLELRVLADPERLRAFLNKKE